MCRYSGAFGRGEPFTLAEAWKLSKTKLKQHLFKLNSKNNGMCIYVEFDNTLHFAIPC